MAPKKASKADGVQTTLSKFFSTSAPSKTRKNITDEKDDFEVITNSSSKRSKATREDLSDEAASKSKKKCIEVLSREGNNNDSLSVSSQSTRSKNADPAHAAKLKRFELTEDMNKDLQKECFQSRNCPMIPLTDDEESKQNSFGVTQIDVDEEDVDENTPGGSSHQASRLSVFSASKAPGKGKKATDSVTLAKGLKVMKYTPLEQQVVDIKKEKPDVLLCVECGYKYRFFGEDAEIAAKVLNIFCHLDHNFMTASIPTHRLFVHLRRLVAAGHKVGVVKQTETAHLKAAGDNKSGPFARKLAALYTKSTLVGEDLNPMFKSGGEEETLENSSNLKQNQHLLCIYEQPAPANSSNRHVGIVCVDPATGDVVYDDFQDGPLCAEMETRISHLSPVEILLSSNASEHIKDFVTKAASLSFVDGDKIRIEMVQNKSFTEASTVLDEFYKDIENCSFVHQLPKPVLGCLSALCVYLKDFELDSVLKLSSSFQRFSERSRYMYLSSQCLQNLEVFHNSCDGSEKGSLFWMLDHTRTKFGSRQLRKWLNQPLLDQEAIQERLDAVEELLEGSVPGIKSLAEMMAKLPDLERGLCSIFHQKCSPTEFCNVTQSLHKVSHASKDLGGFVQSSLLQGLFNGVHDCLEGVQSFNKMINTKAAKDNDLPNLFVDGLQSEGVAAVYSTKAKVAEVLSAIQDHRKEVRLALHQPGLNFTTVQQNEFLIEVKNTQLKTVPSDWTQINSTKVVTRFHSPFLVEHYRLLNQLREQLRNDAQTAWRLFLKEFSSNFVRHKKGVTLLATVDCLLSLASVASHGSFCKPKIENGKVSIKIVQGRHPIIEALSQSQDQYVANDTNLDAENGPRVMTVSGPNMGGKSSYIRQVALISILAQIGSFVPAEAASLGIFDAIYTRMGALDDIFKGRSTFMVELHEAADIMAQATNRSLVILDELGRGTSTHDGVAIAHATLKHFVTKCSCLVMFVTHFPMMSEFQENYPKIAQNFHMAFLLGEKSSEDSVDVLTFLYQLTEGAAARSYGLNVARLAQVPDNILLLAEQKSKELENVLSARRHTLDMFLKLQRTDPSKMRAILDSR